MDVETAVLPTSSRPPPAGQDAVDFKEEEFKATECQGAKANCYEIGKPIQGTPLTLSCQNPLDVSQKMAHFQQNFALDEACNAAAIRNNNICSEYFYENWRNNFESLVYDAEGRQVFYLYLKHVKHAVLLDCLQACEVFRALPPTNDLYISARDFYKRFIQFRNPKLHIHDSTRTKVNQWMRNSSLHRSMFEGVECDVLTELKNTWHHRFISSDYFLNYCLSANQGPLETSKQFQSSSKGLRMPVVEEENTGDFREKDGAHGKEIKGKSMKFSDELRTVQDTAISCQRAENPSLMAKAESDLGDPDCKERKPKQDSLVASDLMIGKKTRQKNKEHEDNLPTLPHFKPRTERISREAMKPMKPEEFANVLCQKLEKVIRDRALAESQVETPLPVTDELVHTINQNEQSTPMVSTGTGLASTDENIATGSCQGHSNYPHSERYSVAGMSSTSGSELKSDSQLKYRHGAKELASAVHHALRTELKECHCQQCLEKQLSSRKFENTTHNNIVQDEIGSQIAHCQCCRLLQKGHQEPLLHHKNNGQHGKLTTSNLENLKGPQVMVDHQRIYSWMEHNEKYKSEMMHPHSIDSSSQTNATKHRHRQPVVYDTSRPSCSSGSVEHGFARDHALPLLSQPDTSLVLEEAKRRLEDTNRSMGKSSRRSGRSSSRAPYMESVYPETAMSTTSDNWTLSDSASSVSRNQVPSIISSSIPSSASQYINESTSNLHCDSVRSHSSGGSRGSRSDMTVVTYFLGLEPIPYRTSLRGKNITLAQFKALITKKGTYRYFFKTKTKDDGTVYQQVENDDEYLPKFENKIVVKVEKVE
ncbi:axin-1-like isoform X2 [Rhopilema esculentum]|uniref:axin-1-like isoform X2 n=1 Tax=Rhopilema esculentum TaxID=499914 RepID=UPI0031E3B765